MPFFDALTQFPDDPIMTLPILFAADPRKNKVNLGIGTFKDAEGRSYIFSSVKKAEGAIIPKEKSKDYLPIDGDPLFLSATREMVFGPELVGQLNGNIFSAQTLGGTSALRVGGDFLCQEVSKTVFIPTPTWPNHKPVFTYAGMKVHQYRYYDQSSHSLDFAGMCSDIAEMPPGSTIILHASCHNPTGTDPTFEQWQELSDLIKKQKVIPFFDSSYQGFKDSIDDDVRPIRHFASQGHEMLVASSFSKNFGLYCERVGALNILAHNSDAIKKVASQAKYLIRSSYSNPAKHGAAVIAEILSTQSLKDEWLTELANMRMRLKEMRHTLIADLQSKGSNKDWSFLDRQNGFFSFSGLDPGQVHRLITDYAIYMPSNGRMNVAGLNGHNIDYVVDALIDVSQT